MNHFLLPSSVGARERSTRYGDVAMVSLLGKITERAISTRRDLGAMLFGGAKVLAGVSDLMHLGERNVDFARQWLRDARIPIVEEDVLGMQARRLEFRLSDGTANVRRLGVR